MTCFLLQFDVNKHEYIFKDNKIARAHRASEIYNL